MQADIDQWISFYNEQRPYSGRNCFGKTPMQTFEDSREVAKGKDVNSLFRKTHNFKMSDEAQTGNAGEQPTSNNLTDGNK